LGEQRGIGMNGEGEGEEGGRKNKIKGRVALKKLRKNNKAKLKKGGRGGEQRVSVLSLSLSLARV